MLEPLYRTTAGRGAAEGLHRDAPWPRLGIERRRVVSAGALDGLVARVKARREHGPDRDSPHGDREKGPQAVPVAWSS